MEGEINIDALDNPPVGVGEDINPGFDLMRAGEGILTLGEWFTGGRVQLGQTLGSRRLKRPFWIGQRRIC